MHEIKTEFSLNIFSDADLKMLYTFPSNKLRDRTKQLSQRITLFILETCGLFQLV